MAFLFHLKILKILLKKKEVNYTEEMHKNVITTVTK
jgi:hypothetical protein